jgi:hypothetical protein
MENNKFWGNKVLRKISGTKNDQMGNLVNKNVFCGLCRSHRSVRSVNLKTYYGLNM